MGGLTGHLRKQLQQRLRALRYTGAGRVHHCVGPGVLRLAAGQDGHHLHCRAVPRHRAQVTLMRREAAPPAALMRQEATHICICGLRGMEQGIEAALMDIGRDTGFDWSKLRGALRAAGRYRVETY